jgi:hypothetical protein
MESFPILVWLIYINMSRKADGTVEISKFCSFSTMKEDISEVSIVPTHRTESSAVLLRKH